MDKKEFMKQLRESLQGEVGENEINEHIGYYENYIMNEMRKGRAEEDVIKQLGHPRLLAKTILDTNGLGGRKFESHSDASKNRTANSNQGFRSGGTERWGEKGKMKKITGILLTLLIVLLILSVIFKIFALVLRVIWPVLLILLLIWLFQNKNKSK